MPFTQRENISHFLTACEMPPLELPAHDRFLTVDLYDSKDPAQVMQCLGAFSRAANSVNPSKFPAAIGPRRVGASSPARRPLSETYGRARGVSNASQGSDAPLRSASPALTSGSTSSKPGGASTSSWSRRDDEGKTAPAWNIHQYGYMGGASQGNQGISFGAKRQIVAPSVDVPSLAEKEQRRRGLEAEAKGARSQAAEDDRLRKERRAAEEEQAQRQEEERWQEESRRARDRERKELEEERKRWEEEERQWQREEEARTRAEHSAESSGGTLSGNSALKGQYLSRYQAEQNTRSPESAAPVSEKQRIQDLERQLEEAKSREQQYQREREERDRAKPASEPLSSTSSMSRPLSFSFNEQQGSSKSNEQAQLDSVEEEAPPLPSRPQVETTTTTSLALPEPVDYANSSASHGGRSYQPHNEPVANRTPAVSSLASAEPPRPLPRPPQTTPMRNSPFAPNRVDQYLATNSAPVTSKPNSHFPDEMGMTSTSERASEDSRRVASQAKTKAGGWASKSLLEKEMERERERQREWEENQMAKR